MTTANNTQAGTAINLTALDSLRGLLAVYVVAGHARWLLWTGHAEWSAGNHPVWENLLAQASATLRYGHEAVMGFFVLSGFFIHLRAAKNIATGSTPQLSTATYARRRIHRLLPPYVLALILTVTLDAIGRSICPDFYAGLLGDDMLRGSLARMGYSAESVAPALVLLPFSLGQHFGTNGPLWSLGYEVVYYALYPLWLATRVRFGLSAYLVLPLSLLVGSLWMSGWTALVISHYGIWLVGAGLAEWLTSRPPSKKSTTFYLALAALMAFAFHHLPSFKPLLLSLALAAIYGGGLVAVFATVSPPALSLPAMRILQYFGRRSYTLYIVHFPLLTLISAWVFHIDGARPLSGWLALTGFGAALALGCLCFHVCERRFLHERIRLA